MPQPRSAVRNGAVSPGAQGGGQSAAAPNPSQPQLKAVSMITKMEEAKRRLRQPAPPGGPAPRGMRSMPGDGGAWTGGPAMNRPIDPALQRQISADSANLQRPNAAGVRGVPPPGSMDAPMSVDASMIKPGPGRTGAPLPGSEMGGAVNFGPPSGPPMMGPPGGDDPYAMLPPRMRESARAAGRDPREAVASRMENDPNYRAQMIQRFGQGGPGGPPAGIPPMQGGGPDSSVSGAPGTGPGGPGGPPPPGADIGPGVNFGPPPQGMPPGAEPGGQMNPQLELQQRLQKMRATPDGRPRIDDTAGQLQGFNPGSLADLYGQVMQGRRPPQPAGSNPFGLGPVGPYFG